ncbi:MAG: hypothetical protein ACOCP8_04945, partial [archaeon]
MNFIVNLKKSLSNFQINLNRIQDIFWRTLQSLLLFGFSFIILYPLFIKFTTSLMVPQDLIDVTVNWIPSHATLSSIFYNYLEVIKFMEYPISLFNSLLLALSVSIPQLISCTVVGY